jgi:uncharacterized cupredoxin-like copper-binding protein
MRGWLAGGAALAALVVAGCAELGLHKPGADGEVVHVELRDRRIDVSPHMVGRGKVVLQIENDGELEHGLRVVGPGTDDQSDEFLVPGQHRTVTMKLGEGTFRIFCPDGNHADLGMWAQLVVTDSPSYFRR